MSTNKCGKYNCIRIIYNFVRLVKIQFTSWMCSWSRGRVECILHVPATTDKNTCGNDLINSLKINSKYFTNMWQSYKRNFPLNKTTLVLNFLTVHYFNFDHNKFNKLSRKLELICFFLKLTKKLSTIFRVKIKLTKWQKKFGFIF